MDDRVQYQHANDDTRDPALRRPSPIQCIKADDTEEEKKNGCSHPLKETFRSIAVNL